MKPAPLLDRIDTLLRADHWQRIAAVEAWLDGTAWERWKAEDASMDYSSTLSTTDRRRGEIAGLLPDHGCRDPYACAEYDWWQTFDSTYWHRATDAGVDPCGWRTVEQTTP